MMTRLFLKLARAVESESEHLLAAKIMKKVNDENDLPEIKDFNAITGKGIELKIEEKQLKVVNPEYFKENNL